MKKSTMFCMGAVFWKCLLPLQTGTTVPVAVPFEKESIAITIAPSQGGVVMVTNSSKYFYPGVFALPEDSILKRFVLNPGKNFFAIPRYAKTDSAYLSIFQSDCTIGVDTVFAILPLHNGSSKINIKTLRANDHGYPGLFNVINSKYHIDEIHEDTIGNPLACMCVRSPFGKERVYINGKKVLKHSFHRGVDFQAKVGTQVHVVLPGRVAIVENEFPLGNTILVDHGGNVWSAYFHLSVCKVHVGDTLTLGQTIALSGNTGASTGPHLHVSMFIGDTPVDFFKVKQLFTQ